MNINPTTPAATEVNNADAVTTNNVTPATENNNDQGGNDNGNGNWEDPNKNKNRAPETVPYNVFAENNKRLRELEDKFAKQEQDKLIAEWKIEQAYKMQLEQKDKQLFDMQKEIAVSKYSIPDNLKKYVTGKTIEEIELSAKELSETFTSAAKTSAAEVVRNNIDPVTARWAEDKDKVLTLDKIKAMTPEEYRKNKDKINKMLQDWLL